MKQSGKYQQLQMKEPSVLSEPELCVWTSFIKPSAQKKQLCSMTKVVTNGPTQSNHDIWSKAAKTYIIQPGDCFFDKLQFFVVKLRSFTIFISWKR